MLTILQKMSEKYYFSLKHFIFSSGNCFPQHTKLSVIWRLHEHQTWRLIPTLRGTLCALYCSCTMLRIHLIPTVPSPRCHRSAMDIYFPFSLWAGSQPASSSSLPKDLVWHSGTLAVGWAAALLLSSPGDDSGGSSRPQFSQAARHRFNFNWDCSGIGYALKVNRCIIKFHEDQALMNMPSPACNVSLTGNWN